MKHECTTEHAICVIQHVGGNILVLICNLQSKHGKHCILGAEQCSKIEQWISLAIPTTENEQKCLIDIGIHILINKKQ